MLDNFIFENHLEQRFVGLENGVYLNYNDLRDYSWSYETINNRISRFYMATKNRKIPLVVCCDSDEKAINIKNRLHELAEADVVARIPGRIYVGDFYTNGYITGSSKSNYLVKKRLCNLNLTLTSDDPAWYKERKYVFGNSSENTVSGSGSGDYPYDYPYDYAVMLRARDILCDTITDNAFRLKIYGAVTDPVVTINAHDYMVRGTVGAGESLLIDSLTKTITHTNANGEKTNWFDRRGREDYIFQPIPSGRNAVRWSGAFPFDLTVIEKRSEPKWT